jgi:hypothetical protein
MELTPYGLDPRSYPRHQIAGYPLIWRGQQLQPGDRFEVELEEEEAHQRLLQRGACGRDVELSRDMREGFAAVALQNQRERRFQQTGVRSAIYEDAGGENLRGEGENAERLAEGQGEDAATGETGERLPGGTPPMTSTDPGTETTVRRRSSFTGDR